MGFEIRKDFCTVAGLAEPLLGSGYEDIDGNELIVRRFYRQWTDEMIDGTKGTFGDRRVLLIPEARELIEAAKARQTYVSTLAAGGVSINTIRQYVGHQGERTTLANYCYDRSTDEEKMKQVQKALES